MKPDDKLCYCFHISQRKVLNHLRVHEPRVASQLSECGGAGTGCGWCVPFLRKLFQQWKHDSINQAPPTGAESADVELSATEYAAARAAYVRDGKGKPPGGAEPLPE